MWLGLGLVLGLGLGLMLGLGLDYGLGFSSDIRLRHDPQLRVSHLATTKSKRQFLKKIQNGGFIRANFSVKLDPCHVTERPFYI